MLVGAEIIVPPFPPNNEAVLSCSYSRICLRTRRLVSREQYLRKVYQKGASTMGVAKESRLVIKAY